MSKSNGLLAVVAITMLIVGAVSYQKGYYDAQQAPTSGESFAVQSVNNGKAVGKNSQSDSGSDAEEDTKGNGSPSGQHYTLNIIGVSKEKSADMDGNQGHRIFVQLEGNSKIFLIESDDFQVLDANGTDGRAEFALPNPDPDGDGETVYNIYARPLGKPGGSATMTTCATDPVTGEEVCSLESTFVVREKGKSKFTNVTKDLTTIYIDLDGDGTAERYGLFDDELEDYFWSYDNNGLKVLQLRFYYN